MSNRMTFLMAIVLILIVGTIAKSAWPSAAEPVASEIESDPPAPAGPRFDMSKVEHMKRDLLARPGISDVLFDDHRFSVEWQVGVTSASTSQLDRARVICGELKNAGLSDGDTEVRIVDMIKLETAPGDFRGASLGMVDCTTGDSRGL